MNKWKGVPKDVDDWDSFVYAIVRKNDKKFYIGQKTFHSKHTLKPLKGTKRKRVVYKPSDWKVYSGSSKELQNDIKEQGVESFDYYILLYCGSKWAKHYWEAKIQWDLDVLCRKDSYNGIIQCRINNQPKNHHIKKTRYYNKIMTMFKKK